MDVPYKNPAFDDDDLNDLFEYAERQVRVIWRSDGEETCIEQELEDESRWIQWFHEAPLCSSNERREGLAVIIGSRAKEDRGHNSSILESLPFSKHTFKRLAALWPIHGDITRVITRSDSVAFSVICFDDDDAENIYYNCRTSSKWHGDLAVSSTFERKRGFTKFIVFGCDEETTRAIAARIENFDGSFTHPLIVIGILVELERERHYMMVKTEVTALLKRAYEIGYKTASDIGEIRGHHTPIDSWAKVSLLRTGLESWETQLIKMTAHIDELECQLKRLYSVQTNYMEEDATCTVSDSNGVADTAEWHSGCIETGQRIKNRLLDIRDEYEEYIKDCTMVIDAFTLASQWSWSKIGYENSQANLRIASNTNRDSGQMKSIAVLTMVFLPATFISSLFSTSFFNWHPTQGEAILSPYIWIYATTTLLTTAVVMISWYLFSRRMTKSVSEELMI